MSDTVVMISLCFVAAGNIKLSYNYECYGFELFEWPRKCNASRDRTTVLCYNSA